MNSPKSTNPDATNGDGSTLTQGALAGQQQQPAASQPQQQPSQQPQSAQQHLLATNPTQMLPQTQPNLEPPKPPTPMQSPQKQQQPQQPQPQPPQLQPPLQSQPQQRHQLQQPLEQTLPQTLPSTQSLQLPQPQAQVPQHAKPDSEKSTDLADPKQTKLTESKPKTSTEPKTKSPAEPKPKTTRARKQTAAQINNKAANVPSATTPTTRPKPEPKRNSKKAKQNGKPAQQATKSDPATSQPSPSNPATQTVLSTTLNNKTQAIPQPSSPEPSSSKKKRKPRATAANTTAVATTTTTTTSKPTEATPPAASPPKRSRKKKSDGTPKPISTNATDNPPPPMATTNMANLPSLNGAHPQLLSVATNVPMGTSPLMSNAPLLSMQQPGINRQMPGMSPLNVHDPTNRYYSLTISPYANYDYNNAASSLTRPSLSRLFTSSASAENGHTASSSHSDEIARAFEDLRDGTWSHLSKCILEQAQQFDIPSLIGTLYTLRSENEKLSNKVRDLTSRRDHLVAMNARLDLPGPMLTQHLNHTSPNFSSVVAGLTNSPKSLPNSSPTPAMNSKSPIVPGGSHNPHHGPSINSLGPPGFIDRNSPLVGLPTPYSGVNSLRSSTISTPSPPTGALMAHGANRASLTTINNPPYMSNVHPSLGALNQLGGPNPPSSPFSYPRK